MKKNDDKEKKAPPVVKKPDDNEKKDPPVVKAAGWPSPRHRGGLGKPSLNPVTRRELVRNLKALGFEGPFAGGKHQWMRRGGLRLTIPIPTRAQSIPGSFGESCATPGSRSMNGPAHEGSGSRNVGRSIRSS